MAKNLDALMNEINTLFEAFEPLREECKIHSMSFRSTKIRYAYETDIDGKRIYSTNEITASAHDLDGNFTIYLGASPYQSEVFECRLAGIAKIHRGIPPPDSFDLRWKRIWRASPTPLSLEKQEIFQQIIRAWVLRVLYREYLRWRVENVMKEELVATVWHPRHLARRLEEGGWEAVEALV